MTSTVATLPALVERTDGVSLVAPLLRKSVPEVAPPPALRLLNGSVTVAWFGSPAGASTRTIGAPSPMAFQISSFAEPSTKSAITPLRDDRPAPSV